MKQHIDAAQFQALPEAQQRALAGWYHRRVYPHAPTKAQVVDTEYARTRLVTEPERLTIGILLEFLEEQCILPHQVPRIGNWEVTVYRNCALPEEFCAPDLIDALWAAVCAVLEREVATC